MPSVLLIEDNPADAELVQDSLPSFAIEHCKTLHEGLDKLQGGSRYDAVLTDLSLPDARGIVAVRRLCEQTLNTPIIVLAGRESDQLQLEAVWLGAHDFVCKEDIQSDALQLTLRYA